VADGDPGWPRYNTADRSTALIDEGITVADDPDDAEREVWASRQCVIAKGMDEPGRS
jgi:para-nitrobenzyl esterase